MDRREFLVGAAALTACAALPPSEPAVARIRRGHVTRDSVYYLTFDRPSGEVFQLAVTFEALRQYGPAGKWDAPEDLKAPLREWADGQLVPCKYLRDLDAAGRRAWLEEHHAAWVERYYGSQDRWLYGHDHV